MLVYYRFRKNVQECSAQLAKTNVGFMPQFEVFEQIYAHLGWEVFIIYYQ